MLEINGKSTWERQLVVMVVIIGRIVAKTCFGRKVGMGSRSNCLFEEACKSFAIRQ